jgi:hypothetical protein
VKLNPHILDGWLNFCNFLLKLFDGTIDDKMKLNENLNEYNILKNIELNSNKENLKIYEKKKRRYFLYLLKFFIDGVSVFPGCQVMLYLLGILSYHISLIDNDNFYSVDYITDSKNTDSINTNFKNTDSINTDFRNTDSRNIRGGKQTDHLYCAVEYMNRYTCSYIHL